MGETNSQNLKELKVVIRIRTRNRMMFVSYLLLVGTFLQILLQSTMVNSGDVYLAALVFHNNYRKFHGAPLFEESSDLYAYAEKCAIKLTDEYKENGTVISTECPPWEKYNSNNTGFSYKIVLDDWIGSDEDEKVQKVIDEWYDNYKGYNFDDPAKSTGNFEAFTQMVWVGSTEFGFAIDPYFGNYNVQNKTLSTAVYHPKGNAKNPDGTNNWDEYKRNVFPYGTEPCPCPEPTEEPTTSTTEKEMTTTEVSMGTTTLSALRTTTPEICRCPIKMDKSSCHLLSASVWIITFILVRHLLF